MTRSGRARGLAGLDVGIAGAVVAGLVYIVVFAAELRGTRQMVGQDILTTIYPWVSEGPRSALANPFVGDPVTQFVPWLDLVRDAFLHGRLPLWNPYILSGSPLLANDQSAPFSPFTWVALITGGARGLTLAMLVKPPVAALGMALWSRRLGTSRTGACFAGIAYASCSFMTVWLAWPHTAVAATFPWCFFAVEWVLATRRPRAVAALGIAVAVQFLAGHAETSLHLGLALAAYALVRTAATARRDIVAWLPVLAGGLLGVVLSAAQLLPFAADLGVSSLAGDRVRIHAGESRLPFSHLSSWLIPNAYGNPGVDHLAGRSPNYLEGTGFIGVGALLLAPVGALVLWHRRRSAAVVLVGATAVAIGQVYGPLGRVLGRLPLLDSSNGGRMIVVACLCLPVLAGAGVDGLADLGAAAGRRLRAVGLASALVAAGSVATLLVLALVVRRRGAAVDDLVRPVHGMIGIWVVVAVLSLAAAGMLAATALCGRGRLAGAGWIALAGAEALLFLVPFNPRIDAAGLPPDSPLLRRVALTTGNQQVAAQSNIAVTDLADSYRFHDVRGYDTLENTRVRTFWSAADPGYQDATLQVTLATPGTGWLRAAGVAVWMGSADQLPPGVTVTATYAGFVVGTVPGPRPFAWTVPRDRVTHVVDAAAGADALRSDPLATVTLEDGGGRAHATGSVDAVTPAVAVDRPDPETVVIDSVASGPAELVVLQAYAPGWRATVDGSDAEVQPADVLFQGVVVPAGRHHVVLRYRPTAVVAGLALSALGLVVTACLLVAGRFRILRRRPSARGPVPAGSAGAPPPTDRGPT